MNHRQKDSSLRVKILATLTVGFLVMSLAFILISYVLFRNFTIDDCVNYARGLNTLIIDDLDVDHIDDYIAQGHAYPGYDDIEAHLYKLRDAYPDIEFLYVYQIREDGCHVVFDLDTPEFPAAQPGDVEQFDRSYQKYIPDLLAGREVPPVISWDTFGYLLTIYTPIYDSTGACKCYAAVDYDMTMLTDFVTQIIRQIMCFLLIVVLVMLALSALLTEKGIVRPVHHLKNQAFQDELTGLENRAAYLDCVQALNPRAGYALAMIDVNFLKRVNDTYGHDQGNIYLRRSADTMVAAIGRERLYRIGGDEFVAVFEGGDVQNAPAMLRAFKADMARQAQDPSLQPWERVSAAVGLAVYDPEQDHTDADVLSRADKEMYQDKLAMKATRRD